MPLIEPGDDLAALILAALARAGEALADGDVLIIAQKIVSKAEGRTVDLCDVVPGERALELAREVDKDPRLVELILSQSAEVVAYRSGVLVVALASGVVLANAGIDRSNVDGGAADRVLLLPRDPDGFCRDLRRTLKSAAGADIGVIVNDSLGRAWRNGTVGMALGAAGVPALLDCNGRPDLFGRRLEATQVALADELAAAASLVMGQADEGRPVVLARGLAMGRAEGRAADLVRRREEDLFR